MRTAGERIRSIVNLLCSLPSYSVAGCICFFEWADKGVSMVGGVGEWKGGDFSLIQSGIDRNCERALFSRREMSVILGVISSNQFEDHPNNRISW
jgi:hypothetical protein